MKLKLTCFSVFSALSFYSNAGLIGLDLLEVGDDAVDEITSTLISPGGGVTLVGGSGTFVGALGDGVTSTTAQSGIFEGVSITDGSTTVDLGSGVVLTSGTADIPDSNTDTSYDPFSPGTGGDTDLSTILEDAGAPSSTTNDVNFIEFEFMLDAEFNAISLDFIFGSDEFPDQGVTDVFGVFVDGVNFAFFPDSSLVSFVEGENADNFIDNGAGLFDIEYDGFSEVLTLVGLVDESLDTHTIKIAIADTSDSIFDSGVFLSGLEGVFTTNDGGVNNPPTTDVSEPLGALFLGLGLFGMAARRKLAK